MASRKFVSGSDVPALQGDQQRDLEALRDYVYRLAEQIGYELRQIREELDGGKGGA